MIYVGTAAWAVPRALAEQFSGEGSHLQRYARRLGAAEINSTFKHVHRAGTLTRWAESTPPDFRFSVKLPHTITHEQRLQNAAPLIDGFLEQIAPLGERLGPLLVQLPGTLAFEATLAEAFFDHLRERFTGVVVCEARHASWFDAAATALLVRHRIGGVAADPARVAAAAEPGGWLGNATTRGVAYFRWHGSPQIYRSSYEPAWIAARAAEVNATHERCDCWCVFDNTASGAAAGNALDLAAALAR